MELSYSAKKTLALVQGYGEVKLPFLTKSVFKGSIYRSRTTIENLVDLGLLEVRNDTVKYTGKEVEA